MKNILTLTTSLLLLSATLLGQTFNAGIDFEADLAEYSPGFTLSGTSPITAAGTDAPGNAISLYFTSAVDMSNLLTNGATLDFVANAGHSANSSFSISLFDSSFGAEEIITGLNFADTTLISSSLGTSSIDLTDVQNIVINTGGIGSSVNVDVSSFTIVPEPSTYALIAGFAAFLFVAIRRRK
jgi:hypothetical protein